MRETLTIRMEIGGKALSKNPNFLTIDDHLNLRSQREGRNIPGFSFSDDNFLSSEIYGVALHMLDLTNILLFDPQLSNILNYGMIPLVKLISNFLLMRKEEEEIWTHDYNQYLLDEEDEYDNTSIKNLALSAISSLIERFGDDAIRAIMLHIDVLVFGSNDLDMKTLFKDLLRDGIFNHNLVPEMMKRIIKQLDLEALFEFKLENTFGNSNMIAWKKKEMGLLLLGSFSQDLVYYQHQQQGNEGIVALVKGLLNLISTETNPVILGRCLWALGRVNSNADIKEPDLFIDCFLTGCQYLSSEHRAVALIAASTLSKAGNQLLRMRSIDLLRLRLESSELDITPAYQQVLKLASFSNELTLDIMLSCLLTLSRLFPALLIKTAEILTSDILVAFGVHYRDPVIAGNILDLIVLILANPESGSLFLPIFIPNMREAIRQLACERLQSSKQMTFAEEEVKINFLVSLIDILILGLRKSSDNNYSLSLLFEPFGDIVEIALKSNTPQSVIKASVCLKCYALYIPKELEARGCINSFFEVMDRLLDPTQPEIHSTYIGNIVMVVTEQIQRNKAGMTELSRRLLARLSKSSLPSTIQGISLFFSRCIIRDLDSTLEMICSIRVKNKSGLKILLDRWLLHQPKFIGRLTKATTYIALSRLFLSSSPLLSSLLVLGYDPSHTSASPEVALPLKILSTVLRALSNELRAVPHEMAVSSSCNYVNRPRI